MFGSVTAPVPPDPYWSSTALPPRFISAHEWRRIVLAGDTREQPPEVWINGKRYVPAD